MKDIISTPYKVFFFLGTMGLFLGLFVWLITGFNEELYFGRMHAHYMVGIFLLSFIIGFLMTAIPRMTRSNPATERDLLLQFLPMASAAFWGVLEYDEKYFFWSIIASIIILFRFCFVRITRCPRVIPEVFPMVILALLSGLTGAAAHLFEQYEIGSRLFYLNFVLLLCVGVGAKLIPMLLRLDAKEEHRKEEFWIIGVLLTLACFVEVYLSEGWGNFLRAAMISLVFFRYWQGHVFGENNSGLAWGVRIASTSILMGTIGIWIFPAYRLEAIHILYVSGFGLLTLMVASRVILAHGQHNLQMEVKNWFIRIPIALIVLASATRVSAIFVEDGYQRHLAYAAFTFITACGFWSYFFLPKLLGFKGKAGAASCTANREMSRPAQ
jgi:uncharacterized protein involved in response to NO